MAFLASSLVAISTNPKPRDRPVSRSMTTAADSTAPAWANVSRRRSVDVENESGRTPVAAGQQVFVREGEGPFRERGAEAHRLVDFRGGRDPLRDEAGGDERAERRIERARMALDERARQVAHLLRVVGGRRAEGKRRFGPSGRGCA